MRGARRRAGRFRRVPLPCTYRRGRAGRAPLDSTDANCSKADPDRQHSHDQAASMHRRQPEWRTYVTQPAAGGTPLTPTVGRFRRARARLNAQDAAVCRQQRQHQVQAPSNGTRRRRLLPEWLLLDLSWAASSIAAELSREARAPRKAAGQCERGMEGLASSPAGSGGRAGLLPLTMMRQSTLGGVPDVKTAAARQS